MVKSAGSVQYSGVSQIAFRFGTHNKVGSNNTHTTNETACVGTGGSERLRGDGVETDVFWLHLG